MFDYFAKIVQINLSQREEEGVDVSPFRRRFESISDASGPDGVAALIALIDELEACPVRAGFAYEEPNDLQRIQALAEPAPDLPVRALPEHIGGDKILGGWLGRASGCKLGQPIEGTPYGHARDAVRKHLEEHGLWPVSSYLDGAEQSPPIDPAQRTPFPGMRRDDDIDYVILNLLILEHFGLHWNWEHARQVWMRHLTHDFIYAAGRAAYTNLCLGLMPPRSATWGNPCRQSLGAMIRCDTWGWVSPGDPAQAASLAHRDAVISQTANGIYSGMFFAAMIAAAFVEDDIHRLIKVGLSHVPRTSRFAEAVRYTVECWDECTDWEKTIDSIYRRYSEQYFNAAIINACVVLLGLLSGVGDFERTIVNTVICGFDADCTGATAGSICGVINGASRLPARWIDPLNDAYETFLAGLGPQRFSNLAERTSAIALAKPVSTVQSAPSPGEEGWGEGASSY